MISKMTEDKEQSEKQMCDTRDWFRELSADYEFCRERLNDQNAQFWRRTYIRTTFSMFEALNDLLREKALEAATAAKREVNISRIHLLGNTTYRIAKNGKLEEEELRVPFVNYVAFLLRSLAEESGIDATFFSDNGWNQFQKAVSIRNRITHPKNAKDIGVSEDDLQIVQGAMQWVWNSVLAAFDNPSFWTSTSEFKP